MSTLLTLQFRPDVTMEQTDSGRCTLHAANAAPLNMQLTPGATQAFAKLANGGATEPVLNKLVENDGMAGMFLWYRHMHVLNTNGLLSRTVSADSSPLISLIPIDYHYRFDAKRVDTSATYQLSRFAYMRQENGGMVIESPLGVAKIKLLAPAASCLAGLLATPQTVASLQAAQPGLAAETLSSMLNLMLNAELLTKIDSETGAAAETQNESLLMWDFHDLLFHTRSRLGRHNYPFGGTYRFKDSIAPLPLIKDVSSDTVIQLPKPDVAALRADDVPFTEVVERRRSWRYHNDEQPITLDELGEFLYRSARITKQIPVPANSAELAFRPYPSGGAVQELEIYPVIDNCAGLASGIYWYNPLDHTLSLIAERNEFVDRLLFMAWNTADRRSKPQIYFAITARFQRLQWKYESMAYATILKHVGALYQTMYLVATAMGLAPCGLGGGDSDMFARAAGLDYYAESPVGDFILGSHGAAPADAAYPQ